MPEQTTTTQTAPPVAALDEARPLMEAIANWLENSYDDSDDTRHQASVLVEVLTPAIREIVSDALTDALHPEFGTEWREPDGIIWKTVQEALAERDTARPNETYAERTAKAEGALRIIEILVQKKAKEHPTDQPSMSVEEIGLAITVGSDTATPQDLTR